MKFAPIELCKKLVKLGCKSESRYFWIKSHEGFWSKSPAYRSLATVSQGLSRGFYIPAFYQNDFTGCHEQARENARLVWGEIHNFESGQFIDSGRFYYTCKHCKARWIYEDSTPPTNGDCAGWEDMRHAMIDSEDWVKYLQDSLAEVKNG